MATVTGTRTPLKSWLDRFVNIIQWTPLTAANAIGDAIEMPASSDRSIQIAGTWDSATAVLQGSNDGSTWTTLTDPQGNAISKTADFIEMISELTRYVRVSTSGGGGSQSLTATLLVKLVK